jgi:leucyl aminopeptidase
MAAQITTATGAPTKLACDALLVACFEGADGCELSAAAESFDQVLNGGLAEHLASVSFKGKIGDVLVVPTLGRSAARALALAGLGPRREADAGAVRRAAGAAARRLAELGDLGCALHLGLDDRRAARAAVEGLLLGSYRFIEYKSEPKPSKIARITLLDADEGEVERGAITAELTNAARDLINEPANSLTPRMLADRARAAADVHGLACEVLDEDDLAERGCGGILGVARGSDEPPRLIMLTYAPQTARGTVALVGKGITFDSGGLSIKPAGSMETMKTDMSGAAAVIAAICAAARLELPLEVRAYIPATENLINGRALKPGDVIRHYGGSTTEVNNTDAEGRLVLADAIGIACEQRPDALVDVATLTGGVQVALGRKVSGYFANDDALAAELERAAYAAGEHIWRLPLFAPYRSNLDSEVADRKNSAGRDASPVIGALYLKDFVREGQAWAHLDIAGTARSDSAADELPRGGTGVAARTLIAWLEGRSS